MADHTSDRVYLQRGGIVRLDQPGTRVTCRSGVLWLTFADDPRDVLLEVDEDFVVDRGGLTLVCAIAGLRRRRSNGLAWPLPLPRPNRPRTMPAGGLSHGPAPSGSPQRAAAPVQLFRCRAGDLVRIRPFAPEEAERLGEHVAGLSPASRRNRFPWRLAQLTPAAALRLIGHPSGPVTAWLSSAWARARPSWSGRGCWRSGTMAAPPNSLCRWPIPGRAGDRPQHPRQHRPARSRGRGAPPDRGGAHTNHACAGWHSRRASPSPCTGRMRGCWRSLGRWMFARPGGARPCGMRGPDRSA